MAIAFVWMKEVCHRCLLRIALHQQEIQLYEGDKLLLFTDGVTEARNADDEEFGEQRLQECLRLRRSQRG